MNNQFIEIEVEYHNAIGDLCYNRYIMNINYIKCIHNPLIKCKISVSNTKEEVVVTLSQRSFDNLLESINISRFIRGAYE